MLSSSQLEHLIVRNFEIILSKFHTENARLNNKYSQSENNANIGNNNNNNN
jgi:hypothetical protein